ncbi:MAG: 23S rRNA (guanosine(2251)-2'-O)-methyltransferase RlmB [Deferrisomatales bacterium]|nr:23S rRNA (guanosine(2251)-2'-O)-methyltransferase RlmB [Deferrisomatales bacterium]
MTAGEWVYGRRPVAEHLAAAPDTCRELLVAREGPLPAAIAEAARRLGLPVREVPRAALDRASGGGNHQGVCLCVGGWAYAALEDLAARARAPGRLPLLLALDCVQDPRNLGAVLRVADGVGAAGVVIPQDRAAGLSAAAARTASGALASVPVARVVNLARSLDALRGEGFEILGADGSAPVDLYAAPVRFPCVAVFGGEHRGIRPNVAKRCGLRVSIPMGGAVGSLNVAVACGVVSYELRRRFVTRAQRP